MKPPSPFYKLNKAQRRGVLWTFFLFLGIHLLIRLSDNPSTNNTNALVANKEVQHLIDSLMDLKIVSDKVRDSIYPFNPNYISDFKAYQLGISMSVVERIRAYRAAGSYLYSEEDLKQVAGLSDVEMNRIRPYLKLPEIKKVKNTIAVRAKAELNSATAEALQEVYGIGPVLGQRIITLRKQLGGFLIKDQLDDVWGLKPEVQDQLWMHFKMDSVPNVIKQNINDLTIAELSQSPYISVSLASSIVALRTQQDSLTSWHELAAITQIDSIKKARLSLYLSFN
ncbi:MAG: helix-hairpin-helix domain-containing protein [Flavobacteriaceae bacterium]|nr:helix-hairpin-helix domain-containing protein [Flavobacteriaceae bacterium]